MLFANPFRLLSTIAETSSVNEDDTLKTKAALKRLGYYEPPKSHGKSIGMTGIPDRNMFAGLRRFQKDQGLARDGIMKPDGPTAQRIGEALAAAKPVPPRRAPKRPDPIAGLKDAIRRIDNTSLLDGRLIRNLDSEVDPAPGSREPGTPPRKPEPPTRNPHPPVYEPPTRNPHPPVYEPPTRNPHPPGQKDPDEPEKPDEPDRGEEDDENKRAKCAELNRAIEQALIEIDTLQIDIQNLEAEQVAVTEKAARINDDLDYARSRQIRSALIELIFMLGRSKSKMVGRKNRRNGTANRNPNDRENPKSGPPSAAEVEILEKQLAEKMQMKERLEAQIEERKKRVSILRKRIDRLDQAKRQNGCE